MSDAQATDGGRMKARQPPHHRERLDRWARQRAWRPGHRSSGLGGMLVGAGVIVAAIALLVVKCGGAA